MGAILHIFVAIGLITTALILACVITVAAEIVQTMNRNRRGR